MARTREVMKVSKAKPKVMRASRAFDKPQLMKNLRSYSASYKAHVKEETNGFTDIPKMKKFNNAIERSGAILKGVAYDKKQAAAKKKASSTRTSARSAIKKKQ